MLFVSTTLRQFTRRRANAAFAAWFCALSFACPLVHAHSGGDRQHTHTTTPGSEPQPGPVHRHFVLFGFDLGSEGHDAGGCQLADGSDPVQASVAPSLDLNLATDWLPPHVDLVAPSPAVRTTAAVPVNSLLSPISRHTVSGVLLI